MKRNNTHNDGLDRVNPGPAIVDFRTGYGTDIDTSADSAASLDPATIAQALLHNEAERRAEQSGASYAASLAEVRREWRATAAIATMNRDTMNRDTMNRDTSARPGPLGGPGPNPRDRYSPSQVTQGKPAGVPAPSGSREAEAAGWQEAERRRQESATRYLQEMTLMQDARRDPERLAALQHRLRAERYMRDNLGGK